MPQPDPAVDADTKVLVLGLGTRGGGEGVVRWALGRGASVRVTDLRAGDALRDVIDRLGPSDRLSFTLGRHDEADVDWADLVVRNPAVPSDSPFLDLARSHGTPVHTETTLFFTLFPGRIVAVTGTKGKTSTCHHLHHLLGGDAAGVFLVGNMGGSALEVLADATAASIAVYETSSFQIETLDEHRLSAGTVVLTNLEADHLDRYPGLEAYWRAKLPLFTHQAAGGWAILPPLDTIPAWFRPATGTRRFTVGDRDGTADAATWIDDEVVRARADGAERSIARLDELPVVGPHRLANVLFAVAGALAEGVADAEVTERLRTLPSIPHRMETFTGPSGRTWINDTAATNPTAAAKAIAATVADHAVAVICGGAQKGLDPAPLVDALAAEGVVPVLLAGTATDQIVAALSARGVPVVGPLASMADAVAHVAGLAPGVVALLAPGCASFGMFADEFDRGGQFLWQALVGEGLASTHADLEPRLRRPRRPPIADLLA